MRGGDWYFLRLRTCDLGDCVRWHLFYQIRGWCRCATISCSSDFRHYLPADRNSRCHRHLAEREIWDTLDLVLRLHRRCDWSLESKPDLLAIYAVSTGRQLAVPGGRICRRIGLLACRGKIRRPRSSSAERSGVAPSPRQFCDRLAEFVDFVGLAQDGKIAAHAQR